MKQPSEGILESFQDRIGQILRTRNDFQKLYIVSNKRSSLDSFCEQLTVQGIGEGIFVGVPLPSKLAENVPGPVYEQIDFSVKIIENIITNETGKSSMLIAEKVASLLHMYGFQLSDQRWTITCRTKEPWTFEGDDYRNIITLHFVTMCSF